MTCQEIYAEHRAELDRLHAEFTANINAAAETEFPDGTAVSWKAEGIKKPVVGKVTGRVATETASVMVKAEGGHAAIVRAWNLTKIPTDPAP
jgi:hypothetical protein